MSITLGIDTGGTYTDAVVFDRERGVLASGKSLTTRADLFLGIRGAVDALFAGESATAAARDIELVSLSTTLATNALVEGHGQPVCLVLIGQNRDFLERAALAEALGSDPVVFIDGGHGADGDPLADLDEAALERVAREHADRIGAFAVSSYFSVRNPTHEQRARAILAQATGLPVTCAHELTSRLDAPRRALTTLLNARLIPLIHQLIKASAALLEWHQIDAPLMIVRGDGSLINAATALERPVETILSGPAASVVGALFLAGERDAVVSDIGGTTTDIAVLEDGRPALDERGATVGGWRTMVEAIAVHTYGLGGDSELRIPVPGELLLGPQRAVPLSLLAHQYPGIEATLQAQLADSPGHRHAGRFAIANHTESSAVRLNTALEQHLWRALVAGPVALVKLLDDPRLDRPFERLRRRGAIALSTFTPSDAAHVLGMQHDWSTGAALIGATLFAPRYASQPDAERFCRQVVEQLIRNSAWCIAATLATTEANPANDGTPLTSWLLNQAVAPITDQTGALQVQLRVPRPIIGIGAPAHTYYGAIAERLGTRAVIPPHAEVCNAVGAVASGIAERARVLITAPSEERFRAHTANGIQDFDDLESAASHALEQARLHAEQLARHAGGTDIQVSVTREDNFVAGFGGHRIFIESVIIATAAARPRHARSRGVHVTPRLTNQA